MKKYILILNFFILGLCFLQAQTIQVKQLGQEYGLSSDFVMSMAKDKQGFIWVATEQGLNRFNGSQFISLYKRGTQSISGNDLNCLLDDPKEKKMWIGTQRNGLDVYDYESNTFRYYLHDAKNIHSIATNDITSLAPSLDSSIWITTYWNGIDYYDRQHDGFIHYNQKTVKGLHTNSNWCVLDVGNGLIYAGHVRGGFSIIDTHNRTAHTFRHQANDPYSLAGDDVHCIFRDKMGNIWIGSDGGLDLFDAVHARFVHYGKGVVGNHCIFDIKQLSDGKLWIATELNGVVILHLQAMLGAGMLYPQFQFIREGDSDHDLSGSSVRCILEDDYHNVWLGLYGGGVNFIAHRKPLFSQILYSPVNPKQHLSIKAVIGMAFDRQGRLVVGTDGDGVNVFDKNGCRVACDIDLPDRSVQVIHRDRQGNLWLGCFNDNLYVQSAHGGGLRRIFSETQDIRCMYELSDRMLVGTSNGLFVIKKASYEVIARAQLTESLIRSIDRDRQGNYWIGTFGGGVVICSPQFKQLKNLTLQEGLPSNTVNDVHLAKNGHMWLATSSGLVEVCHPEKPQFVVYSHNNGYADNNVRALAEDSRGNIWMSTVKSISCKLAGRKSLVSYDYHDHITMGNFNPSSVAISPKGLLFFGSTQGITYFDPTRVLRKEQAPQVYLTSMHLAGSNGVADSIVLLMNKKAVDLRYTDNTFTVIFNSLNYALQGEVEYAYRLKGLSDDWTTIADNRVTFRNLPYGNYTLEVKCRLHNQEWSRHLSSIDICVNPPFWLSWWAKMIYLVIFVLAVFYIVYSYRKKIRLEYLLSAEQHKHEQEQLLNEERMRFFTNITHELRTPLTLIIGPLLDMSKSVDIPIKEKHRLHIILNSAERLRKLITQILEFRKTETDTRELSVTKGNIVEAVENITRKYIELNQNHKLQIRFEAPESDIEAYFDRDMLAIIVDNLMSNALKYTERGSVISRVARRREGNQHLIDIIVADTGYGIAESALPHIFERFYQENGKHQASGTGIGLSLVKKLVTLHQGTIRVESSVEKGSTFTVTLDENNIYPSAIHGVEPAVMLEDKTNSDSSADTDKKRDKAIETDETILVIEDNAGIRQYIADSLSDRFTVYQAADGREGLAKALDLIPTIVISDIMMPAMDGNELCKALKTDMRTSHIPVILLTAKDSNQAKEEGYEAGADSYITKPFSRSLLVTRIDNLIAQRKRIIASFSSQSVDKTSSMDEKHKIFMESMNKNDQQFFERFHALIDENMKGTLDMDYLTGKLNMSTSSMYRKIKALTGISTNEYIRHYKMHYAEKLLLENKYTISEIAYEVGFSSLPYFRKCFKDEFGVNPSDYLKKIKS